MNLQSLIEARQEAFAKEFGDTPCLDREMEMSKKDSVCTRKDSLFAFHTQTIKAILEAQCAMLEGRKKEILQYPQDEEFTFEEIVEVRARRDGFNSALSEIIASNRELLKKLQS